MKSLPDYLKDMLSSVDSLIADAERELAGSLEPGGHAQTFLMDLYEARGGLLAWQESLGRKK